MKKIVLVLLLVVSGLTFAACGNSTPVHSKSFNAGVAWVRHGFPGSNETFCDLSVLKMGGNCATSNSPCDSNAAALAVSDGNHNMQQWINGCASVPFKHYPKWYRNYVFSLNS